jgi:hypothetical protein
MKGSEALLRAIASAGGGIPAVQLEIWVGQLVEANLLEKESREDDDQVFYYHLTERSREFLRKKGVDI